MARQRRGVRLAAGPRIRDGGGRALLAPRARLRLCIRRDRLAVRARRPSVGTRVRCLPRSDRHRRRELVVRLLPACSGHWRFARRVRATPAQAGHSPCLSSLRLGFVSSRSAWDCGGSPGSAATPRLDAIGRPRRSLPVDERHRSRSSTGSSRRTGRRPIRPRSRVLFPTGARAMRSDASVSTQLPAEVPDCLPDRGDVRGPSPPRGLM